MPKVKPSAPPEVAPNPVVSFPTKAMFDREGPQFAANWIPAPLRPEFDEISAMADGQEGDRIRLAHAMGAFVARATGDRAPYGEQVVYAAAVALGTDPTVLYRAQKVHSVFPDLAGMNALVERGRKLGYRVTATHFAEFSRIKDTRERVRLIEETLRDRLSTRELRKRVDQHFPQSPRGLPMLALAVENITVMSRKLSKALHQVIPDQLLEPLGQVDAARTRPETLDKIAALTGGMEQLAAELAEYAGEIAGCLARVRGANGEGAGAGDADGDEVGAGEHEELDPPEEPLAESDGDEAIGPDEVAEPAPPAPPAKKKLGRPRKIVVD